MTRNEVDFSALDSSEIRSVVFHPRKSYATSLSPNAENHRVEVEKGIRIGCRFHRAGAKFPSLLYFHGNGEIVDDYDSSAHFYTNQGINLFVADYRGYGFSNGTPTLTNLMNDTHKVFEESRRILNEYGSRNLFVMGRSLGSIPAIEAAYHYQSLLRGLILESCPANNLRQYLAPFIESDHSLWNDDSPLLNKVRLRSIAIPTLIIHAEGDSLIPLAEGKELYTNSASRDKHLEIIPNADHNNLMVTGQKQYYHTIGGFVKAQNQ
ncbi:MAG: lysophospholipase [Candidatus Bathyarchaeota archaeon]|nr:lysophospholipase [Candidatus Bathyarchaeota archaeon]